MDKYSAYSCPVHLFHTVRLWKKDIKHISVLLMYFLVFFSLHQSLDISDFCYFENLTKFKISEIYPPSLQSLYL